MQNLLRLKSDEDFRRVRQQGRSWATPVLVLYARRNETDRTRVGYAVGKRLGKAVVRNRVKRRLREAVRQLSARLAPGWDLLFVARSASANAAYPRIVSAVENVTKWAGLLVGPPATGDKPAGGPSVGSETLPGEEMSS